jgi:hypothetical protein
MRPNKTSVVAVALAGVALAASIWNTVEPYTVRQDAAVAQQDAAAGRSLAEQVAAACAKGGAAAAELGPAGVCAKAAEVKDQPPVAQAAAQVDPGQLRRAALTAVAEYCAAPAHPCRGADGSTPPFDAIVDAVVAKIPAPQDGRDGRDAPAPDYAALVASYCGQASEPCRGPKGEQGDPPPCMAEPSQCRGATGERGQAGPTCPDGYELRDAVITAKDGTTYSAKVCVDPNSSAPPGTDPPLPLGGS